MKTLKSSWSLDGLLTKLIVIFVVLFFLGSADIFYGWEFVAVPRAAEGLPGVEAPVPTRQFRDKLSLADPGVIQSGPDLNELPGPYISPIIGEELFYLTGRVVGVEPATINLYDRRGGRVEVYDQDLEIRLLGSTMLDRDGYFRIGPLEKRRGFFYRGVDLSAVLELNSRLAVAYSELHRTAVPYRFKLYEAVGVDPTGITHNIGKVDLTRIIDDPYPVDVYNRTVSWLREQQPVDRQLEIRFIRGIKEPIHMEREGILNMPYRRPR